MNMLPFSSGKDMMQLVLPQLRAAAINGSFAKAAQRAFQLEPDDSRLQHLVHVLAAENCCLLPPIELLDGQTMEGLLGAYTTSDLNGQERIYLNADWMQSADASAIEAVLLGRKAMGEAVRCGNFRDRWRVRRSGTLIHAEDVRMTGDIENLVAHTAVLGGDVAFATLLYCGPARRR